MKLIKEVTAHEVHSEPGDGTHYHYVAYIGMDDRECWFIGMNGFKYPKSVAISDSINTKNTLHCPIVRRIAEEADCNPWTVIECLRFVRQDMLS